MNRRLFLTQTVKLTAATTATLIIPHPIWANSLINDNIDDDFTIQAYLSDYQQKVKSGSVTDAVKTTLKLSDNPYAAGEGASPEHRRAISDIFRTAGLEPPKIPATKFKHVKNPSSSTSKVSRGQTTDVFSEIDQMDREAGAFTGPLKVSPLTSKGSTEYQHYGIAGYVVHPAFLMYTQMQEFICYGNPCENPIKYTCQYCDEKFIWQKFYFEGDSKYERKVSEFYYNGFCANAPKNSYGQKIHNGWEVKLSDIGPCNCILKPTSRIIETNR